MLFAFLLLSCLISSEPAIDPPLTVPFDAPKYGLATRIPKDWRVALREEDDRIFVAIIPQQDFDRPGIAACELALAPETLDDYRTRIDTSARKNGRKSGKLASNVVKKDAGGEWLETIWEFHPDAGGFWHEVSVRKIANRQLYTFVLNVEDSIYQKTRPAFDALVSAATFTAPNTGADLLVNKTNRWIQREYRFALDLPDGWRRALRRARSHYFLPTDLPRVSGRTICWCSHTRTPTSISTISPRSCPISSSKRIPTVK